MIGELLNEGYKNYKFRVVAYCIENLLASQDYEFTVTTSIFSSAPFFVTKIPNVIIPIG